MQFITRIQRVSLVFILMIGLSISLVFGQVEDAKGSTLIINNVRDENAGEYYCKVSNSSGSANSNKATLTVLKDSLSCPEIRLQFILLN